MQLSFMIDNTVFRTTSTKAPQKNIVYEPKSSLLDNFIYLTDDNYFILENNTYTTNIDNVINLPNNHIGLYNYHFLMTHNIEKHINDTMSAGMHIPILFIIDQVKSYKKEDKHIIHQKLNNHTKLYLNENTFQTFNSNNKSILIKIGIPIKYFQASANFEDRKDIAIFDYGPVTQQLKFALEQNKVSCTLINTKINLETFNYLFNRHKICLDISDNYLTNLLPALCCGCKAITTKSNPVISPFINHIDLNDNIVSIIKDLASSVPDNKAHIEYVKDKYPFEPFKQTLKQIINDISHEVYTK